MKMVLGSSDKHLTKMLILAAFVIISYLIGCATTPMETHQKGMENITEKEYFVPKKPVDRHFIGCAWSKQFGPVEDPGASDIRIKVEKSFNTMQQNFAYNVGVSLGAQTIKGITSDPSAGAVGVTSDPAVRTVITKGATVEAGVEAGKAKKSQLEDVQIISPVSLADVPFEQNIPYITEALRLGNFALKSEKAGKAGVSAVVSSVQAGVKGAMEGGAGTSGEGLVVAYKLHMIDPKTYAKQDSGSIALELDKTIDFPKATLFARSYLRVIDPGSKQPLPRNLLWTCDQANAKAKDMVAAWIIELRSTDPKRKSLQIAFPAFPKIEDCQSFSGVIYSRIDPLTDKIIRQKINITIIQDELSDSLKPKKWEASMSLVDESFNIKLVKQGDLGK
jgi:hypothetical protein